jgi:hypothetical protein
MLDDLTRVDAGWFVVGVWLGFIVVAYVFHISGGI